MTNQGYWEPPRAGDELDTLLGSLERMRATFSYKAADLPTAALRQRLGPSELTLGRLLKHLAYMEDLNFTQELVGHPLPEPWATVDAEGRSEWAFTSADDDSPDELYRLWTQAVDRSRSAVAEFAEQHGAGGTFRVGEVDVSLRRLLVDLIEEYGRHTGHADLLRESIDGRTGEDPPGPRRFFDRSAARPARG